LATLIESFPENVRERLYLQVQIPTVVADGAPGSVYQQADVVMSGRDASRGGALEVSK
jgi:hypothetical protein